MTRVDDRNSTYHVYHKNIGYWYCYVHDDAFAMELNPSQDPFSLKWEAVCCYSKPCDLSFIGYRIFDANNVMIHDSTYNQSFFDRCGGGYEKEYLDQADTITLS